MSLELLLNFSDTNELIVSFDGESSSPIAFENPITAAELQEVRWYLETYGAQYTADVDDDRAGRIVSNFKKMGIALYKAVASASAGAKSNLMGDFLKLDVPGRLVTIQSGRPEILTLPWELLHQPDGAFLFNDNPRVSIRRNLAKLQSEEFVSKNQPKETLRLLMLVSRPQDASFIDPRADSQAVMAAIERYGTGRIELEFLRPGTLAALVERLENKALPQVDILHFDGHGVFDATGAIAKQDMAHLKGFGENTGYLLFENGNGMQDLVSAERLGQLLHKQGLGLVVLSACQSSMMGQDEQSEEEGDSGAIGSVAARFTQTGVQSVVAMSYSVLVKTTESLFGAFYGNLVQGRGIGESLDNARRTLLMNPDRGKRQRGSEQIPWKLADWFVPTLYQLGNDVGMLLPFSSIALPEKGQSRSDDSNLPSTLVGFFGRQQELWQIERAFTPNPEDRSKETRRMTIAGFGGQGKTALAAEAGRWLVRSGLFEIVVFVDYAAFQGMDPIGLAVSTIARDLAVNLIDADAVTEALGQRKTLLILDNLEDLQSEAQQALLTEAVAWSEAGQSRVLITTRQNDLNHPNYSTSGYRHRLIALQGLGTVAYPDDAVDYFQELMKVPPQPAKLPVRKALIELFGMVDFHPLSIGLVAEQLRMRGIVDVIQALDRLLLEVPAGLGKDRCLVASLNLSLERLDAGARQLVRRLGVFEGGAFEDDLLAITEFAPEQWQPLRRQLESAGLVRAESLENVGVGVPFLKFHPTLARVLWASLGEEERDPLQRRHRERYYALSGYLYQEDRKNPYSTRAIAQRELPNLLVAVRGALDAGEEWAVEFVTFVSKFLNFFGMNGDRKALTDRAAQLAQSVAVGSQAWYLARSNAGEQLWQSGQPQQAKEIFEQTLLGLGETISYERCFTLGNLGRCLYAIRQLAQAAMLYLQTLDELAQLEASDDVKRVMCITQSDLGDVLRDMGDYGAARQAYEASLVIADILDDKRQKGVVNAQLGTLRMSEGNLAEAEKYYQSALATFQTLEEPDQEAIFWHQLGIVYQEAKAWEQAERAYRASAQLREAHGNLAKAAMTWNQLAIVCANSKKPKEAEAWYRKAIMASRSIGDIANVPVMLNNLANLLQTQGNFTDARQVAEEALSLMKMLDAFPGIWVTYDNLAKIAAQQGESAKSKDYRRLSHRSYSAFTGSRDALQQSDEMIQAIVAAIDVAIEDGEARQQLEESFPSSPMPFAKAIQQILAGIRDDDKLCDELNYEEALIVGEILRRL
jgi:tetratricopeptide (TPR) repeat protein